MNELMIERPVLQSDFYDTVEREFANDLLPAPRKLYEGSEWTRRLELTLPPSRDLSRTTIMHDYAICDLESLKDCCCDTLPSAPDFSNLLNVTLGQAQANDILFDGYLVFDTKIKPVEILTEQQLDDYLDQHYDEIFREEDAVKELKELIVRQHKIAKANPDVTELVPDDWQEIEI